MRPPLNQVRSCVLALSLVFALIAFLFLLVSYTAQAQGPTTRYVAPGGDCGGVIPCYVTIQTAIDTAVTGDTIKVAQGVYTSTAFQVIYISKAITVTGGYVPTDWANSYPVTRPTVIDAENVTRRRAVHVDGTNVAIITLTGLTIQRGWAQADGGGVYIVTGTVVLEDSRVISNTAGGRGGGVYVGGGTLFLRRSIIQSNSAAGSGGGVYLSNSLATLTGNTILSNTASYEGGGLYAEGGQWLGVLDGSVTVSDNTFEGNSASVNGGGAHIGRYVGASVLSLNRFLTNTAQYGGGVYLSGGPAIVSGTSFQSNTAFRGGGLYMWASTTTLSDCEFSDNQANEGGAVYADVWTGDAIITISDNLLHRNRSHYSGALYIADGRLTLSANTILSNTAASSGAGIEINSGIVSAQNDIVAYNISPWEAVHISNSGFLTARHWTLVSNGNYAVTIDGGSASLTNTIVASHTVGFSGVGIAADHTLFFNTDGLCGAGASCPNSVSGDPGFTNPEAGDFHIRPDSAAIDAGINTGVSADIDGEPRFGNPDVGADEYWAPGSLMRIYLPLVRR